MPLLADCSSDDGRLLADSGPPIVRAYFGYRRKPGITGLRRLCCPFLHRLFGHGLAWIGTPIAPILRQILRVDARHPRQICPFKSPHLNQ